MLTTCEASVDSYFDDNCFVSSVFLDFSYNIKGEPFPITSIETFGQTDSKIFERSSEAC